jgi:hypothetical protein
MGNDIGVPVRGAMPGVAVEPKAGKARLFSTFGRDCVAVPGPVLEGGFGVLLAVHTQPRGALGGPCNHG